MNNIENSPANAGSVKVTPFSDSGPQRPSGSDYLKKQEERARAFRLYAPSAALIGLIFTICVYHNRTGIALVALMAAALILNRKIQKKEDVRSDFFSVFLEVFLILLTVSICTTDCSPVQVIDKLLIPVAGALLLLHSRRRNSGENLFRIIIDTLHTLFLPMIALPEPVSDLSAVLKERSAKKAAASGEAATQTMIAREKTRKAVLTGLLIGIPLFAIVSALLLSADEIFLEMANNLFIEFDFFNGASSVLERIFQFLFGFWCAYCVWKKISSVGEAEEVRQKSASSVTAVVFMLPVDLIYLIFSLIQLIYVLGRKDLPDGISYAEYVHSGFYQLCAVAVINLILIAICHSFFDRSLLLDILQAVTCACTYIMIASGALRMKLYVEAYQFTFLRMFVLWFMLVLAVCLTLLVIRILRPSFPVLRSMFIAAAILWLGFAFLHPDLQIARFNLEHSGADTDYSYLTSLSEDAVPALKDNPEVLDSYIFHHGNGTWASLQNESAWTRIRCFNLSNWTAYRYLKDVSRGYSRFRERFFLSAFSYQ